jgi:hypothetical protein
MDMAPFAHGLQIAKGADRSRESVHWFFPSFVPLSAFFAAVLCAFPRSSINYTFNKGRVFDPKIWRYSKNHQPYRGIPINDRIVFFTFIYAAHWPTNLILQTNAV